MKPQLRQSLGQHLTLTPQLRMAIRMLQLSAAELEQELSEALQSNPLLERADEIGEFSPSTGPEAASTDAEASAETEARPEEPSYEGGLDDPSDWSRAGSTSGDDPGDRLAGLSEPEDLRDHLLWQLHLSRLGPRDRRIGLALIEAIGEDGYLAESIEAIQEALRPEVEAGLDEILAVLQAIQHFDPVGVGARNLSECLLAQLGVMDEGCPAGALARELAAHHLEALARLGVPKLATQLKVDEALMDEAVAMLRALDPRPGAQLASPGADYITPDCVAWREGGVWQVALAPGSQPRLAINRHYEGLVGRASREDANYLRGQLQEARWLIKSLETRADTVLRVARCIVRQQSGFLEHGPQAMRPLTLREVAEELGLHESTISRATARKYLTTPRGTLEFRDFFASGVANAEGGATSSTAIQAMLRKLIEAEDPRKPLSDERLARELKAGGVPVARRTVAKYREAMNIPSSNERQRLG